MDSFEQLKTPIYFDHHATTPILPVVAEAIMDCLSENYANPGSVTHEPGRRAKDCYDRAVRSIAAHMGADSNELIITSGSTESCNLAILGFCKRLSKPRHLITVASEHRAVLDPVKQLEKIGWGVTRLSVGQNGSASAGQIDPDQFAKSIRPETAFASVMVANNEIGVLQPIQEIAKLCRQHDIVLHSDATQALGKVPVQVNELDVDLMSFSAHKFYGPVGTGGLFVRRSKRRTRLLAQIVGGGQQMGMRSGTLNLPGVVGMQTALQYCVQHLTEQSDKLFKLRNSLWKLLSDKIDGLTLNGPELDSKSMRLPHNLNFQIAGLDGQTLMQAIPELAISSGAACSAASPEPSHVLRAIGLNNDQVQSSLRIGLGRGNNEEQVRFAAARIAQETDRLRRGV